MGMKTPIELGIDTADISPVKHSRRYKIRDKAWKIAEASNDLVRMFSMPLRFSGNIVRSGFRIYDDLDAVWPLVLSVLIGFMSIATQTWIGYVVGAALEAPIPLFIGASVGEGTKLTIKNERERRAELREKRAARRATWR